MGAMNLNESPMLRSRVESSKFIFKKLTIAWFRFYMFIDASISAGFYISIGLSISTKDTVIKMC